VTALLATELLKLRTLVLPWGVLATGAVGSGVIGYALVDIASDSGDTPTLAELAVAPSRLLWFLAAVVAVLATAGEFQHRTLAGTLLQEPRRGRVLAAKAAAAAAYGAGLAALGAAAATAAGAVAVRLSGAPATAGDLVLDVPGSLLLCALWAVAAVGLGALVRNGTVALVTLLVWTSVVEQVVPIVTRTQDVQRWLPSQAADAVLGGEEGSGLSPAAGGLLFTGYAAVIVVAGALVFVRRDPT